MEGPDLDLIRGADLSGSTVAVLTGGTSGEREIALQSGRAVCAALEGASDGRGPRAFVPVEIEPDGRWSTPDWSHADPAHVLAELPADTLYFLALHGGEGEGGGVQAFLEVAGRRFVGSGSHASRAAMDKHLARDVLTRAGVLCARGTLLLRAAPAALAPEELHALLPCIVKPRHGGSSVATTRVLEAQGLPAALERAFAEGDDALVEALVAGVEASVGVLEVRGEPRALTPVEIRPRGDHFFDYEQKYDSDGAVELCPPEGLAPEVTLELERLALRAHRVLGCRGFSRTDFIVTPAGAAVALELNTIPGLVERSLLPRAAAADGISFRDLVLHLLAEARDGAAGTEPARRG